MTHRTSIVVTTLCNELKAFASDLSDDQSRYLLISINMLRKTLKCYIVLYVTEILSVRCKHISSELM